MTRAIERPEARGRRAYTLVELSIALAIIGILASVSGSQYMAYLDRARTARAIAELRAIAKSLEPQADEEAVYPSALADLGLEVLDPWGNPYRYLLIQGNLPRGLSGTRHGLPDVAAPGGAAGAGASGSSGGGGTGGATGGASGGGAASAASASGGGGRPSGDPSIMGQVRKDRFQVPINRDFDLYSMGPDGDSRSTLNAPASRDDIIRANDGAFYGVAEEY
ncbi:MAG: prepilin-type N-terminal cleavage/methylation domain-containing protein [Myxococcota bacterium]